MPPSPEAVCAGLPSTVGAPNPGSWVKKDGDIGCGWGATYNDGLTFSGWSDVSSEVDCCLFAMGFEASNFKDSGKAVRFQFFPERDGDQKCRVDRERFVVAKLIQSEWSQKQAAVTRASTPHDRFMHTNLDRSSGKGLIHTGACGPEGAAFYMRYAVGAAEGAPMKPAGRWCDLLQRLRSGT